MPGSEEFIQTAVHALEAGGLAVWVKCGAVAFRHHRDRHNLSVSFNLDRTMKPDTFPFTK